MIDAPRSPDTDLSRLPGILRRSALPILAAGLLAGGGAYLIASRQTPVYQAGSSLLAVETPLDGDALSTRLASAPPPPAAALEDALHSPPVLADIVRRLDSASLNATDVSRVQTELQSELSSGSFAKLSLDAAADAQQGQASPETLHARDRNPQVAAALADAGVAALQQWDIARVQRRLGQAQASLERQLAGLPAGTAGDAARAQLRQDLTRVAALQQGVVGTLEVVAAAVPPSRPESPQPRRSALIAGLLALLAATGLAVLFDSWRRRVEAEGDLARLGVPLLGRLPRLAAPVRAQGVVGAVQGGPWYEGSGFLRVNLLSQLPPRGPRRVVVSSARAGEGKSSVVAALAEGLAGAGLRVLVLDADPYRGGLGQLWPGTQDWHPLAGGSGGAARTLEAALDQPGGVQVRRVSAGVDLLPSGGRSVAGHPQLGAALERWGQAYDVVLLDTPPVLVLSDATALAAHSEGLVLVAEAGVTRQDDLEQALTGARIAGVRVLGVVLNRARPAGEGQYRTAALARPADGAESLSR